MTRTISKYSAVFMSVMLVAATGGAVVPDASAAKVAEITAGKKLAEKLCARCHATGKTGQSPDAKAPAFRAFAQKWPLENLEEALAEGIVVGAHVMPEFEFDPDEISNLLAYIGSLSD